MGNVSGTIVDMITAFSVGLAYFIARSFIDSTGAPPGTAALLTLTAVVFILAAGVRIFLRIYNLLVEEE